MTPVRVLRAGTMTSIQDWPGRLGLWHVGVPPSGPMDDEPAPLWELLSIPPGSTLDVGTVAGRGRRAYVLLAGGLAVDEFLGSASTFTLGVAVPGGLSGAPFAAVVGLGATARLYPVVEKPPAEAHRTADTPMITASFFAGFLLLLLL